MIAMTGKDYIQETNPNKTRFNNKVNRVYASCLLGDTADITKYQPATQLINYGPVTHRFGGLANMIYASPRTQVRSQNEINILVMKAFICEKQ